MSISEFNSVEQELKLLEHQWKEIFVRADATAARSPFDGRFHLHQHSWRNSA